MSRPKRQPTDDADQGPLVITMLAAASEQLADAAVTKAAQKLQNVLHEMGFADNLVIEAGELPGWGTVLTGLDTLIREAWVNDAARIEARIREEGFDPEVEAGIKVPHGVVPS